MSEMKAETRSGRPSPEPDAAPPGAPPGPGDARRWSRGVPVPAGISPRTYFASLAGPLLVSASLGVQLVLAAVLLVKPPRPAADLTRWGAVLFVPELDVVIFLAGVTVATCLGAGLVRAWNRRLRTIGSPSDGFLIGSLAVQAAAAVAGGALFLNRFFEARGHLADDVPIPGSFPAIAAAIGLVSVACAVTGWPKGAGAEGQPSRLQALLEGSRPGAVPLRLSLLDLVVPAGIFALIYIPAWRQMSGRLFMEESLFHWDWFAMGPTLSFQHGAALGTDVYAMYGVGWPLFFSAIDSWLPISYGRMIQVGSLYACVYLTGLYLLFRLLVRRPGLAALGTGLAIGQFVLGMDQVVIWRFPSYTVMRWAFDVWCLIALILHWRSRRWIWAAAAGLSVGLALLFSTDTGLYLAAAVGFYWLGTLRITVEKARQLRHAALSVAIAAVVVGAGLLVASRGTLFTPAFWRGWLEPLREFGSGFAQLPLATAPNALTIVTFAVVLFGYLAVLGYSLNKLLHDRACHFDVFNGSVAVYGLLSLNHFIGRSGDYTLFRLYIPLAVIAVNLAGRAYGHAGAYVVDRWGQQGRANVLVRMPYLLAALAVGLVVMLPRPMLAGPILEYPNLVSSQLRGRTPDGLCLLLDPKDICGLDPKLVGTATAVRQIAGELAALDRAGERVAVIDESGSLFYLAAGTAPWSRYPRIFVVLTTRDKVEQLTKSLEDDPPDYILTRLPDPSADVYDYWWFMSFGLGPHPDSTYSDTWEELLSVVGKHYRVDKEQDPFVLWKLAEIGEPDAR